MYQTHVPIPHISCPSHYQLNPLLGHEHMISQKRILSIMYDILSLTNSTLLVANMNLLCTKKTVPTSCLSFPFS
jgi:hypothetical protein